MTNTTTTTQTKNLGFVKEQNGLWYADLPEFLEKGFGTKSNLLMVDGADSLLDIISGNTNYTQLKLGVTEFEGFDAVLDKIKIGKNQELLDQIGHAPVEYGAYYLLKDYQGETINHRLWLCPVTEYVFGGYYPDQIFFQKLK